MLVALLFCLLELGTLVARPPAAGPLPSRPAVHRLEWRTREPAKEPQVPAKAGGHLDPVVPSVWRLLRKLGG